MRSIKYIPLFLALLLAACNKYDIQPEQAEKFIKYYSSTLTEVAYDVKETADGGFVAIGTTRGEDGARDLYLVKTDKYGNEESWSPAIIGDMHDDVGISIQVETDGYVILGHSNNRDTTVYDMYLVKTDVQGNVVWETWTGDAADERGTSLQIISSGEYLAAGLSQDTISGNYDYKIVQFDISGNIIKTRILDIDPAHTVLQASIIVLPDYYLICGTGQFNGKSEINIIPINKDNLFADGGKSFVATGDLTGNCIQELTDGNLIICGTLHNPLTGLSGIYLNKLTPSLGNVPGWESPKTYMELADNAIIGTRTETGNEDIIVLHCDAGGNEVSRSLFGDEGFQQGVSLEITGSGTGLILVGNNGSENNSMMALVKTDAAGKL